MTPTENLLDKLSGVRKTGSGWVARCPAHDDKRASLSIGEGDDGKALVRCHAGCATEQVVAAAGLTMASLFPPKAGPTPTKSNKPTAGGRTFATAEDAVAELERQFGRKPDHTWEYHNERGDLIGLVCRWNQPDGKKDIRPVTRCPDGWRIGAMDEPRPLYGLPKLLAAEATQPVLVVEGEKCCDSAMSLGFTAVTSAGGSQAATKTDWRPLRNKEVIILPDHDAAGEKYADDVARLVTAAGAASVRILRLADHAPGLPHKGDLVDVLSDEHWCGLPLSDAAGPAGLAALIERLAQAVEPWRAEPVTTDRWPEIRPFEVAELPRFPTQALPPALRCWVECEAVATQTPTDLAGLLVLAVVASVIARRVEVEARPGWREPANLFVAVLLEPGNRKSAVFTEATRPLRELEAEAIELARPAVARAQSERRQAEAKLRRLEKQAAEKDDRQAQVEAYALAEQLAVSDEATLPRWLCDDATAERLGMLLAEQNGRIASVSAEGGVFDLMAGLYSKNGATNFGVYLQGHSGDDLITDRVNRPSLRVQKPALTCAYTIQPQIIRGLAGKAAFRGRGLLARFLYAIPASQVGHRQIAPPPMPAEVAEGYRLAIRALAERLPKSNAESDPLVLRLTPQAHERLLAWETEIEAMLADDGAMELIRDWGAKLAGATLRIAAALHCIERLPDVGGAIDAATLEAAVAIGRYLIPHAAEVLGSVLADADCTDSDARYILRWIRRHHCTQFSRRELYQGTKNRFPQVELIDPALNELVERGYIRPRPADPTNSPGRPAGPTFEVNPVVFTPKTTPQNPQKSPAPEPPRNFGDFGDRFGGLSDSAPPGTPTQSEPEAHLLAAFAAEIHPQNPQKPPTPEPSHNFGDFGDRFGGFPAQSGPEGRPPADPMPDPDGGDGATRGDDSLQEEDPRPQQSERPDFPPDWNPDDVLII